MEGLPITDDSGEIDRKQFRRSVLALSGTKLVCYCKPEPCHGDVIAEYLNNSINDIESINIDGGRTE